MEQKKHIYIAVDLKSLYASVECISRQLDPLTMNLVAVDTGKTEKTICLVATPSLKKYGISGRARLLETVQTVKEINAKRRKATPGHQLVGGSYDEHELNTHPELAMTRIAAPLRMAFYLEQSTRIYDIYLRYISVEDIHVYSIDEVFLDMTGYPKACQTTPRQLAKRIITDILNTTSVAAAAGIGTNLYLCEIAMDIVTERIPVDSDGVRITQLDEMRYRRLLWNHRPLADFWCIGKGYAKKLEQIGLYTMGDIARCSFDTVQDVYNEDRLYQLFGVSAELLIDHTWGCEPYTMADIKVYQLGNTNIGTGQVLSCPIIRKKQGLLLRRCWIFLLFLWLTEGRSVIRSC